MKTIFYSKNTQFELTESEYKQSMIVWNKNLKAYIPRLKVSLSPLYIWAGDKPIDTNRKQNHDRQWCLRKFGQWYLENNPDVRVDVNYYPELLEINSEEPKKQIEGDGDNFLE